MQSEVSRIGEVEKALGCDVTGRDPCQANTMSKRLDLSIRLASRDFGFNCLLVAIF